MSDAGARLDRLFGELLVEQKLVRAEEVADCLRLQEELARRGTQPVPALGELLVQKGYLSLQQLQASAPQAAALASTVANAPPTAGRVIPFLPPGRALPPEAVQALENPQNAIGKYVRVARLGSGGAGEVWRAWDTEIERWVALKLLKQENPDEVARFAREAQAAGKLNHPNICAIYEVGEQSGRHYIAMQCIEGVTLAAFPKEDVRLCVELVRDAALAVHHAHEQGVVHRDIKPANIMVEGSAGRQGKTTRRVLNRRAHDLRVYVMDFGLARLTATDSSLSQTGWAIGTPAYMSPEQARGDVHAITPRSDVYALGATLYDMLARHAPFVGASIYHLIRDVIEAEPRPLRGENPAVDADLDTIVQKAMDKEPERRYATALELAEELTRWLEGEPILAHPPSIAYRVWKYAARRKLALSVAALFVAVVAGAAGLFAAHEARLTWINKELSNAVALINYAHMKTYSKTPNVEKETRDALEILDGVLRRYPDADEAHYQRARALYLREQWDDAEAALTRSIELLPTASRYYLRGRIRVQIIFLMHAGAVAPRPLAEVHRAAAADLRQAIALRASGEEKLLSEAFLSHIAGHHALAIAQCTELLQTTAAREDVLMLRGWSYMAVLEHDNAERDFGEVLKLRPHYYGLMVHYAVAIGNQGRYEEAIGHLTAVLAARPRNASALMHRALYSTFLRRFEEAQRDTQRALSLAPASQSASVYGTLLLEMGRHAEALEQFDEAIRQAAPNLADRNRATLYCNRGWALEHLDRPREAIDDYAKALELYPRDPNAYSNRGRVRVALGEPEAGIEDLNRAIAIRPAFGPTYLFRARAYLALGKPELARADLDLAIERTVANPRYAPHAAEAHERRGDLHAAREDWAAAAADYARALDLAPSDSLRGKLENARRKLAP